MYNPDFIREVADDLGEDPEDVFKAFWLQEHIKENGIDGVHYMKRSSAKMRQRAHITTKSRIISELKSRF